MTIKVSLSPNADPPVTVNPTVENVNQGNQTITWVQAQGQPDFTFVGVAFLKDQDQFTNLATSTNPVQMSVTENNDTSGTNYPYVIMVNLNGVDYCSVKQDGTTGNGGTPTIHNN